MTVSLHIRWDEGSLSVGSGKGTGELRYVAVSDDPANDGRDEVLSALLDNVPRDLFGLAVDTVSIEERISDADTGDPNTRYAHWDCIASYINPQRKQTFPLFMAAAIDPRPIRLSFRNGGGKTINRTRSDKLVAEGVIEDIYEFEQEGTEIKTALQLKVNEPDEAAQFSVKGLPVPTGTIEMGIETVVHNDEVNAGWFITAARYAGENACNDRLWHGFAPYTMKMIGFTADQRADTQAQEGTTPETNAELWDVNFTFEHLPDRPIDWSPIFTDDRPKEEDPNNPGSQRDRWLYGHEILDTLRIPSVITKQNGDTVSMDIIARMAIHRVYPEYDFFGTLRI